MEEVDENTAWTRVPIQQGDMVMDGSMALLKLKVPQAMFPGEVFSATSTSRLIPML